ncbi:hypothetical protein MNBD_BACTEROID07-78 [hydrothermal vent metagenome]|uniref:Internalin n=1 Tax=hydrothermal vent metagenome TaxID=652676 RepID=A0A3B0UCN0_9ZZZZ
MLYKINLFFWIGLFSFGSLAAQQSAVKLSPKEIDAYKTQCHQMIDYLQGTLNFLGDPANSPAEKEIIINNSYLKIFENDKVQIEGDLDAHRMVPIHKDVQAYLKDVVFFFKKVTFTFNISSIVPLLTQNGQIYFKVTMNRNLKGITVEGDTVNNNQLRYVEINLNPEKNSLKIASIYTNKPNDDIEIQYWWNHLSQAWKNYFGRSIRVYDSLPLNKIISFSDSSLVVETEKIIRDSLQQDSTQLSPIEDSLLVIQDSVMLVPDTLAMKNTSLMVQLIHQLRKARVVDISGNLDIENLAPLSEMDNLRSLNCAHTLIDDLTPLRSLSRLQTLDITGCPVETLDPLRYISALREIDAAFTSINKVKVLGNLRNIEILNLAHTRIDSLPNLKSLQNLRTLELDDTPLQNIDSLASLSRLTNLSIAKTAVKDFTPLARLTALQSLNLDSTLITDLHPLGKLDSLTVLQINGTRVSYLLPLAQLPALKFIYCDNSRVSNKISAAFNKINPRVQVIYNSKKLEKWWKALPEVWKNIFVSHANLSKPITKEQLHKLLLLKKLNLRGNTEVRSLKPLAMLIQLKELNISGTSVRNLEPLASVMTLRRLDVSHTRIQSLLPLQRLKNLRTINIKHTAIRDLLPLAHIGNLTLVLADSTRVKQKNVFDLEKYLPKSLILFQTSQLRLWWNNLEEPWQAALSRQMELDDPPTAGQLQQLANLRKISIGNHLDIESVEPLAIFAHLITLKLDNTSITDITPVAGLKKLKELSVTNSPLWNTGPLAGMKQLERLNLENTSVEDLYPLQGLHRLQKLNVSGTKVRNLKPLAGLSNLRELVINNTRVNSLKYVMPLSRLTLLRCDHTLLRERKVQNFKEKHPKTKVIFY